MIYYAALQKDELLVQEKMWMTLTYITVRIKLYTRENRLYEFIYMKLKDTKN